MPSSATPATEPTAVTIAPPAAGREVACCAPSPPSEAAPDVGVPLGMTSAGVLSSAGSVTEAEAEALGVLISAVGPSVVGDCAAGVVGVALAVASSPARLGVVEAPAPGASA